MIESLYGNGLVLLGIWVSMSLVMLLFWGVLAWAVLNIISRKGSGSRRAGATADRNSHHLRQIVGDDSRRRALSGSEKRFRRLCSPMSRADSRRGRLGLDRRHPIGGAEGSPAACALYTGETNGDLTRSRD
jgi:hypothetical protein